MEAILTFGRGRQKWLIGGEGEGREKREQIRPCTKCSLHACSFTLCLSFLFLRSAVTASFDIKKLHRNATNRIMPNKFAHTVYVGKLQKNTF
jgi:hypothetical protein